MCEIHTKIELTSKFIVQLNERERTVMIDLVHVQNNFILKNTIEI
jgi:hypothetical protein